ncbi:unnamed protein product [Lathyrus sativus]|nr:unnamed protein product [Lathyrus sativus]
MKADKPIGTQLFGQAKKETSDGALKGQPSKSASKKAQQKPQESNKKKGKATKPAAKNK